MIEFTCTHCQARLNVSDHKGGHHGKCPKCGRPVLVPLAGAAGMGHAALKAPARAVERVEDGEIPLAEESGRGRVAEAAPLRAAGARVMPPVEAGDEDEGEIPLTDEPGEKKKEAAKEEGPPATAGGLVIMAAGDATVVSFQNAKILDAMVIETIGQELYALVEGRACRKLVLDMGHVKFLSSQMLGVLAALQKKSAGIKGRVVLCGVQGDLQKLFRLVSLDRVLPIVADRQAAMAALSKP